MITYHATADNLKYLYTAVSRKVVGKNVHAIDYCYSCELSVTEASLQLKKTCQKMYLPFLRDSLIPSRDADLGVILSHNHEFQLHPSGLTSCYLNLENAAERTFLSLGHTSKAKKE